MAHERKQARTAHGGLYWLVIGWWLGPIKWVGRVAMWLVFWPVGLWRSIAHSHKTEARRAQRSR